MVTQDGDGNLPLHITASFQTSKGVLAMIQKCPPYCSEMENHNNLAHGGGYVRARY
jgi:hypothetical protein